MSWSEPRPLSPVFADRELAALAATGATLERFGRFEQALTAASAAEGLVPESAVAAVEAGLTGLDADLSAIRDGLLTDGLAVPAWLRQVRARMDPRHREWLHFGATSQDVVDTANALYSQSVSELLAGRLADLLARLRELDSTCGGRRLTGRTRMQAALPVTAAHRLASWRAGLISAERSLAGLRPTVERVQLGGPVGDRRGFAGRGDAVAGRMAEILGLAYAPCWHTDRSGVAAYGGWLASVANACGKIGQDIALMAQMGEIALDDAGRSSSMPHKRNPTRAEALVALARHAAGLAGTVWHAGLHEQERSGAAWTLESLVMPPLVEVAGAALRLGAELLGTVRRLGDDAMQPQAGGC